ncbi:hypothetical protein HYT45_02985 [Candidatus Uhrbacteria bacterium]|nr:hypothetical protein [Candidatus Uhrbacteria bacterium]
MKKKTLKSRPEAARKSRAGFLEHLFGSRTRVKLLRLFLRHPGRPFFVRQLEREVGCQIHAVRRELERFCFIKLLRESFEGSDSRYPKKKFYVMDEDAPLAPELRTLMLKSQFFAEQDMTEEICRAGRIGTLLFCGAFLGDPLAQTDLLIVGRTDRGRLKDLMEKRGKEIGFDIRYTVMTPAEFKYRRDVADKFLLGVLDGKHVVGYKSVFAGGEINIPQTNSL